jgi:poly(3-hydroxybutyrate) depolymerase
VKGLKPTLVSAIAIGLLAGSVVGVAAQGEAVPATASAGCDEPRVEPGEYEGTNDFEEAGQGYWVVVPQGYAELAPAPLILWLASGGGTLDENIGWWRPYLDAAESVFVVAEQRSIDHRGAPTLTALIDQLEAEYCIDTRRVHAMGQSSSGPTVAALACDASDRIASFFVAIRGFASCTPERPVPLLAMTGDPERRIVTRSVEYWSEDYGCDREPVIEELGSGVTRTAYQGCLADIVLYDVRGAGHQFIRKECVSDDALCYTNEVFDQLSEVERFFAEHPLPAAE